MSEQLPSEEGLDFTDLSAFDSFAVPAKRLSRNGIVAVAAGLVLACGVGVGFAYVNSSPSGDASFADASGLASPDSTSSPSPTKGTISFVGSGKDAFDNTVAPRAAGTTAAEVPGGAASPGSSGSVTTTSTTTSTTSAASSGGTGTSKPGGSKVPVTTPAGPVTPTPSRSTAPAWEQPLIKFVGPYVGDEYEFTVGGYTKYYTVGTVLPGTSTVFTGSISKEKKREMTADEAQACKDRGIPDEFDATQKCTVITETVSSALFLSTQGTFSGWLVAAGTQLPAAALGEISGTVRDTGLVRNGKYVLQVGPSQVDVAVGQQIPGTSLTLRGRGADEIGRTDVVALTGADGSLYFSVIGGGEDAGVLF